ncbi:unnamed protein product, partial [Mesorhabditis belari]|uniref:Uncharacterized protein n=1 Tax=Mesorhabditis belari TaxID=2138241 RepID=A0AAF3F6E9_9BILA
MVHALELKILQLSEHPQTALIALEMVATGNLHDDNKKAVLLNCLTLVQELIHNPSFCATSELGLKAFPTIARIKVRVASRSTSCGARIFTTQRVSDSSL